MTRLNAPGLVRNSRGAGGSAVTDATRPVETDRARRLAELPVQVYRLPALPRWWQFWKRRP